MRKCKRAVFRFLVRFPQSETNFSSLSRWWPLFPPPVQACSHLTLCGFYLCHRFEVDIFVDAAHSQLGYKNSDAILRRAACFMMLFSVSIALLLQGKSWGSHCLLSFLVGASCMSQDYAKRWDAKCHFFIKRGSSCRLFSSLLATSRKAFTEYLYSTYQE